VAGPNGAVGQIAQRAPTTAPAITSSRLTAATRSIPVPAVPVPRRLDPADPDSRRGRRQSNRPLDPAFDPASLRLVLKEEVKGASSARGPGLRAAPGRRPRRVPPAGRFLVQAIPTAMSRRPGVRPPVSPSTWPLDPTATTTHIKSARGVPTGSASRLLTYAALAWVGSYQGRGRCGWRLIAAVRLRTRGRYDLLRWRRLRVAHPVAVVLTAAAVGSSLDRQRKPADRVG
jgi:hypothetical protein